MALIDFILNVAALLLWLNRRSLRFDPLFKTPPVTLIGTLRRAEPRRMGRQRLGIFLLLLLLLRALLYYELGSAVEWTPRLNLGVVVLAFRSDSFWSEVVFSILSFVHVWVVFYFWLLALAVINRQNGDADPIQKLVRLHLGRVGRWPWPVQALLPLLVVAALWIAVHPVLLSLDVVSASPANWHLFEQGLLLGVRLYLTLKYLLPPFLLLHLIVSYVYLGASPFWDFISLTALNLLQPLRGLPLRFGRLDLAPLAGVILIYLLLHMLPRAIHGELSQRHLSVWPQ
jgi:uncharacterized protein YggT (Ycf19 family)